MTRPWPTVLVLLFCLFGSLAFLVVLDVGQDWRCHRQPDLRYCQGQP